MTFDSFGLGRVRIRGFRSARDVVFDPRPLCALVGEPGSGKSNVLSALWRLLSPAAPHEDGGELLVEAAAGGQRLALEVPSSGQPVRTGVPPPAVFLPAALRSEELVAPGAPPEILELLPRNGASAAAPALGFVDALARACEAELSGVVLLIEEPELFLRPQAQRYLSRLLRDFAAGGNQVVYSTHAPAFLNVGRLDELALVKRELPGGTAVFQPQPLPADESFRAVSEFDAERSELLLARAVLLVEGRTEKLAFPAVFRSLGYDADREGISIVECGGKPNIPVFAGVCKAVGIPYVVVHDRDAPEGSEPTLGERALNDRIAAIAGPERSMVLVPDFEGVAGLTGESHKPERAWRRFVEGGEPVPDQLAEAVTRVVRLS